MGLGDIFGGGGGGTDYSQAIQAIQSVEIPKIEQMRFELEKLVQQGRIDPIQAQAILQEQSKMAEVEIDPLTREAQMKSLQSLQDIGSAEGLDPQAQAKLYDAQETMRTTGRGAREAAMQRAAERGIGGSGLELANVMQANQAGAGQAHKDALQAAADASQRGLEAIYTSGQLGGQIRGQDWQQEAEKAAAQDAINQFNVMSRQSAQEANVGRQSGAQYYNLGEKQRLADTNVAMEMEKRQRDADLYQRDYENRLNKQSALANIYGQQAQSKAQQRAGDQAFWGNMIGTGATLAGTMMAGPAGGLTDQQLLAQKQAAGQQAGGGGQMSAAVMPQYGPRLPQKKVALNYQNPYGQSGFNTGRTS